MDSRHWILGGLSRTTVETDGRTVRTGPFRPTFRAGANLEGNMAGVGRAPVQVLGWLVQALHREVSPGRIRQYQIRCWMETGRWVMGACDCTSLTVLRRTPFRPLVPLGLAVDFSLNH